MEKHAWLITHDTAIDRRIYFFSDYFQAQGYKVKLFAGEYNASTQDPPFVIRPVSKILVKEYTPNSDDIPFELMSTTGAIIRLQEEHFQKNHQYADTLKALGFSRKIVTLEIHSPTADSFTLTAGNGSQQIIYNHTTKMLLYIHWSKHFNKKEHDGLHHVEEAIFSMLSSDAECGVARNIEGIDLFSYYDVNGDKYIRCNAGHDIYDYSYSQKALYKIVSNYFIDATPTLLHYDCGEYKNFRDVIYDYSPILASVDQHAEEPPSIIYVADLPTLPIGIMAKEAFSCPLIIDCHEWWRRQSMLWEPKATAKIALIDHYEKELYPKADLRITVGKELAAAMGEEFYAPFETVFSVVNTSLMPDQADGRHTLASLLGLPEDSKTAIFQGSLTTLRNLETLMKATKFLAESHYLVICGGGPYEERMRKILDANGNPARVIWVGWIPQNELMRYTQGADVGILPYVAIDDYYAMSMPNKLMEYINAGLPIIADTSMLEISNMISENEIGQTTDCRDPQILGSSINRFLLDDNARQTTIQNCHICAQRFTQPAQVVAFHEMLNQLTSW